MDGDKPLRKRKRVTSHTAQLLFEQRAASDDSSALNDTKTEDTESYDYICPICFGMISEAHVTKCGHSFCYTCICKCITKSNKCPQCNYAIEDERSVFPNFLLNELIAKYKKKLDEQKRLKLNRKTKSDASTLLILDETLDLSNVNLMLGQLKQRKQELEGENEYTQNQLLKEFLSEVHSKKFQKLQELTREVETVSNDLQFIKDKLDENIYPANTDIFEFPLNNCEETCSGSITDQDHEDKKEIGYNGSKNVKARVIKMAERRRRICEYYDDLESCYLSTRNCQKILPEDDTDDSLTEFKDTLSKFTKFSSFRPLATLNYASDIYSSSSIVSSIEFDKEGEHFAIAGVTKKIKVYDYNSVTLNYVANHYPITEMICNSKISSIIWSTYHKSMLASSDYDGTVTLWDAFTAQKTRQLQEHEKRCWSIDFNKIDPKLLASGSDDNKVKLWYTNMPYSIASIDAKANVCCVKFSPESRYHLAFGSADHCVHYYDLRKTTKPIMTFKGHKKAVSYTKFLNSEEIVSASTDSQLKLWNVNKKNCLRTYQGHTNDKNFVGLATDGNYIACGSENNSLYVYYKGFSKKLISYKFDGMRGLIDKEKKDKNSEDSNEFVSAVCWKKDSNVVVTANSQGIIKVLELV